MSLVRYTTLAVTLFVLTTNTAFAAASLSDSPCPVRLGALLGLDMATISTASTGGTTVGSKLGLAFGIAAELRLAESFYLQPEIAYVQQGASFTSGGMTANFNYNTLKIPLFLKFQREVAPSFRLYALFGPSIGFAVSRTLSSGTLSSDVSQYVKGVNFALDAGAGAEYAVTPAVALGLGVRYSLGLTNILNGGALAGENIGGGMSAKTRDLQVLAHVFFTL